MESMTHQLQEKKKQIEDVSNSINNGYVFIYTPHDYMHTVCNRVSRMQNVNKG